MTKEIIIDGVDVSECSHFKYEGVNCVIHNTCCWGFDCNYKQLKRKDKECGELKERLNTTCFDPKNNNCRCISYNRIAEDYQADLIKLRKVNSKNMELEAHLLLVQNMYDSIYREKKDMLLCLDNIIKEFEIESIKDVRTGKIIYRSKKLLKMDQAFENLRKMQKYWNKIEQDDLKLSTQNNIYKARLNEIEKYCEEQNLKYDNTARDILNIINNTKENIAMFANEPNQKEMQFIYGESKGCTAIYAIDKPSPNNNSYHEFIINYEPDSETSELLGRIKLQNGNFKEFGHNGIFTEHLLVIARDCLERFNTSKYACQENSIAINNINTALMWLNKRSSERVKRGVYGTETV